MTEVKTPVELVEIKTTGTRACTKIGMGIAAVMKATENALDDGWQPGTDIPTVLMGSYQALTDVIAEAKNVKGDIKANAVAATRGFIVPISEGLEEFLKDDEVEQPAS
ncbi:MAG: hypothetical protein GY699_09540 [Desulfobacteraceae bacterium]|nr:hypothetical protein [Desulfobacteraceae bacterium]